MVVRILQEGQYDVQAEGLQRLNELDRQAFEAVAEGNEQGFRRLFDQIVQTVRAEGQPLAADDLRPSELILPASDSTMDEVRALFLQEGLIESS
ncbi:MAG: PspA-associated protein PspAA [Dehalococcoidia bacterium]